MEALLQQLSDWLKGMLVDGIMNNLSGMFDAVNQQVADVATQVGNSPANFSPAVFGLVRNISETVIIPIAGMFLTFIACYELIQLIIEHNNLANFETWIFFKWIFKTFVAVMLITNTFNIVMAVFDVGSHVVTQAAASISGSTSLDVEATLTSMFNSQIDTMGIGELIGLGLETMVISLCMKIMSVLITVILYGRMIEIYLYVSVAPVPFATMTNREWGSIGSNYLKGLIALAFQGFFIMVCVAIYAVLVSSITVAANLHTALWGVAGYTIILCFSLFKTGSLSKSIFNAH